MIREAASRFGPKTAGRRIVLLTAGWSLIVLSPIVGVLPGPGFIILFPLGLALVLRNSRWARRQYVGMKRRFPEYGRWTDWALRRRGVKKRPELPPLRARIGRIFGFRRST